MYFRPFSHPATKQSYYDGGIYHNNPINVAERERKLIWPNLNEPDLIISVGTGRSLDNYASKQPTDLKAMASKGFISQGMFLANLARDHIAASMDSEQTWRDYRHAKTVRSQEKYRYIRLNTLLRNNPPRLDDVSKMDELRRETRKQFENDLNVKKLARRLVATSFYFQPDPADARNRDEISGV